MSRRIVSQASLTEMSMFKPAEYLGSSGPGAHNPALGYAAGFEHTGDLPGDSVVHLSGIEQSLLYLLASRAGRVVTRDEILDAVWGTDFVADSNVVDRHIRGLRIKLQNDYRHPRFIATVPGEGYRFIPTFSNAGWAVEGDLDRTPRT